MDEYRKGLNANTKPVIEESELLTESKPSANKPKTVRKKIKKAKAKLPLDDSQRLLLQTYKKCTTPKTKK
jgi:hypothetical protein